MKKLILAGLFWAGAWLLFRFATRLEIDLVLFFLATCATALYFAGAFHGETGSPATLGIVSQQLANLYLLVAAINQVYATEGDGSSGTEEKDLEQRSRHWEYARLRRVAQLEELTTLLERDCEISVADANDKYRLRFWWNFVTLAALASGKTPDEALGAKNDAWDKHQRWINQHEGERIRNECIHQRSLDRTKHKIPFGDKACPDCEALAQASERSFKDSISHEK